MDNRRLILDVANMWIFEDLNFGPICIDAVLAKIAFLSIERLIVQQLPHHNHILK